MATRREIAEYLKEAAANLFFRYRYSCTYELGVEAWGRRRADVVAVKLNGDIVIVEVKSSVPDFINDKKMKKYLKFCDRFYLCFTPEVWDKIKSKDKYLEHLPKRAGVIVLRKDGYAKIVKPCKIKAVDPETRMAMLARLAWRSGDLSKRNRRARVRIFIGRD